MNVGVESAASDPALEGAATSTWRPPGPDERGDPVCWMHLLCPECGRLADQEPPTRCPSCDAPIPGD